MIWQEFQFDLLLDYNPDLRAVSDVICGRKAEEFPDTCPRKPAD